jgi:hypothetical protein
MRVIQSRACGLVSVKRGTSGLCHTWLCTRRLEWQKSRAAADVNRTAREWQGARITKLAMRRGRPGAPKPEKRPTKSAIAGSESNGH